MISKTFQSANMSNISVLNGSVAETKKIKDKFCVNSNAKAMLMIFKNKGKYLDRTYDNMNSKTRNASGASEFFYAKYFLHSRWKFVI